MDDDYRARNCRSVNSTPLIRNRRLFLYKDVDEPSTDPECAEDWLHSKLQALKGRREPIARNKKEAEKMLLEELKNKATKLISKESEGDPLEEYKKEEQRLKNTKSPFNTEIDGLRKANKFLQNERAKQNFFKQSFHFIRKLKKYFFKDPSFISSTISKSLPSTNEFFATQRSLSAAPGINNINNFNGQSQHFGNLNSNSPIPQANVKRGATPTGQILSSKPPTPPPNIRGDNRERSKSPHNSKLILKNSSKKSFEELEPSTSSLNNSAVNPNLLALRQSLYAKERQRMGLPLNGNVNELINYENNNDEDEFVSSIENQKKKWALPGLTKNTESNFQQQNNLNNQQLTNVKPILKRGTQQQQQLNNGTESPILNNKKQFSEDLTPNYQQKQHFNGNNWSLERSDTPQFPLVSDRETPLPYHPLLYKSDDSSQKLIFTKNISQSTIPANR
ncbi:unnamed protein product [Meloidogyne enterolobii]|uniref:Uncharacterized protein n=1 Tax=Meloidogyne enterolobii TaxID=390850 RepID=A0ACB0ZVZ5_MELEN